MKTFNTQPRPGWMRSPDTVGPEVTAELSRLSSENAKLREEVAELQKLRDTSGFAQGNDSVLLSFQRNRSQDDITTLISTWDELFIIIARRIMEKPQEYEIRSVINKAYFGKLKAQFLEKHPFTVSEQQMQWLNFNIINEDFERIRTQLTALKLIQVDQIEYKKPQYETFLSWKLTFKGNDYYARLLAERKQISVEQ